MHCLHALLDTSVTSNFISQQVVRKQELREGEELLPGFRTLVGRPLQTYKQYVVPIKAVDSKGRSRETNATFIAADFVGFDAVLGLPWLTQWNANIHVGNGEWYYVDMSDVASLTTMIESNETSVVPSLGRTVRVVEDPIDDLLNEYRNDVGGDAGPDNALVHTSPRL